MHTNRELVAQNVDKLKADPNDLNNQSASSSAAGIKKIITVIAAAALCTGGTGFLTGCTSGCSTGSEPGESVPVNENSEETAETENTAPEVKTEVFWVVEDGLNIDSIDEMESVDFSEFYSVGIQFENQGYPSDFYKRSDLKTGRTVNVITARQGVTYGLLDYSGNVVYPFSLQASLTDSGPLSDSGSFHFHDNYSPIYNYGYGFCVWNDGTRTFSNDFRTLSEAGGIGGNNAPPCAYFILDNELHTVSNEFYHYLVADGIENNRGAVDIVVGYPSDSDLKGYTYTYDAWQKNNAIGFAIVENGNILYQFDGRAIYYTNGFVLYEQNGKYGFVNGSTGQKITEAVFDDAKYFVEDYAPVKKDGKWAYIDSTGKQVTDFVFEDASTPYEGRVFVKVNGIYKILDLDKTVKNGTYITKDLLGNEPFPYAGTAVVNVDNLNVRTGPGTSYDKTEFIAAKGITYNVYETAEADGYTWYRIGNNQWIADDGTWLTFTAY